MTAVRVASEKKYKLAGPALVLLGEIVQAPDSHPVGDFVILRETSPGQWHLLKRGKRGGRISPLSSFSGPIAGAGFSGGPPQWP